MLVVIYQKIRCFLLGFFSVFHNFYSKEEHTAVYAFKVAKGKDCKCLFQSVLIFTYVQSGHPLSLVTFANLEFSSTRLRILFQFTL